MDLVLLLAALYLLFRNGVPVPFPSAPRGLPPVQEPESERIIQVRRPPPQLVTVPAPPPRAAGWAQQWQQERIEEGRRPFSAAALEQIQQVYSQARAGAEEVAPAPGGGINYRRPVYADGELVGYLNTQVPLSETQAQGSVGSLLMQWAQARYL